MDEPAGKPAGRSTAGARTVHRARTAFIIFLATPESKRPQELNTLKKLADEFGVSLPDLYGYLAEPGFVEDVVKNLTYWRSAVHDVIRSIHQNSTDRQRPDQMKWAAAYMAIVEHPAATRLRELLGE